MADDINPLLTGGSCEQMKNEAWLMILELIHGCPIDGPESILGGII